MDSIIIHVKSMHDNIIYQVKECVLSEHALLLILYLFVISNSGRLL